MKHTLSFDGAPYNESGERTSKTTSGTGRARCACGWLSDELPSRAARKNAFNTHKVEAEKPPTKAKAEKQPAKPKASEKPVDGVPRGTTEIPYVGVPKVHWKFFREISQDYAASVDGIAGTRVDNGSMSILVAGTAAARKTVAATLPRLWKDAEVALRANDRSRKDELRELNKTPAGRRSRIPAEGEFLSSYCNDLIKSGIL